MYFYSINKLKSRLEAGPLPEKEALPYVIAFAFLASLIAYFPGPPENKWDYIEMGFALVLAIVGTIWLFKANGGQHGKDFIHRYIILGWVVAVRFATGLLPAAIGLYFIAFFANFVSDETNWFDCLIVIASEVLFYLYFGKHLSDLRKKQINTGQVAGGNG